MAPKERKFLHTSFKIPEMYSVCREHFLLRTLKKGGIFRLCPSGHIDWTKLAQCTTRSCILRNRTIIRPLDKHCRCTSRPWGKRLETISRSLWHLVTEEKEEQDIVCGQTNRHTESPTTTERVLHKLDLPLTSGGRHIFYLFSCNLNLLQNTIEISV